MIVSMSIRRWAMLAAVALYGYMAPRAQAQGLSAPQIKLDGVASVDRAAAGSKFEAAVVMDIPAPFHVNAHKPSEDYLRPTTLTLQPTPGLTFGPVVYPPPQSVTLPFSPKPLLVHEGRLVLRVSVTVARTAKPGVATLHGQVEDQACNAQQCFLPRKRPLSIPVTIAPAGTPSKPAHSDIFRPADGSSAAMPPTAGAVTPLPRTSTGDA